ncbi:MAG: DUF305 domain-containing protein, partial [Myxococcales bacterium]
GGGSALAQQAPGTPGMGGMPGMDHGGTTGGGQPGGMMGGQPGTTSGGMSGMMQGMQGMMGMMGGLMGPDSDRLFIQEMIPHHQGAVDMALAELRYGKDERLRRLAQEIVVAQKQEIEVMKLALRDH